MKKKIFCILLAVSMMCSSLVVYAEENPSELEESLKAESPSPVLENEETGPETTPEFIEKVEPEEAPEATEETSTLPEWNGGDDGTNIVPGAVPTSVPEEPVLPEESASPEESLMPSVSPEATQEPTVSPSEVPSEEPAITPGISPEPTISATPDASVTPGASESPSASPTPSVTPGISPTPSISPEPVSIETEDEVLGATQYLSNTTLVENTVINGNLYIEKGITVKLNNHKLTVNGNVVNYGTIEVGSGILSVTGDFRQVENELSIGSGRVDIGGDLRMQEIDAEGNYAPCSGYVTIENSGGRLNVNGDLVTQSQNPIRMHEGTTTLKGDLIAEEGQIFGYYYNYGAPRRGTLIMAGSNGQKISLGEDSYLGYLQLNNSLIEASGYLKINAMSSNGNIRVGDEPLKITKLNLNNHTLTICGDVLADSGKGASYYEEVIQTGGVNGHLVIEGNYRQTSGVLAVDEGRVDITGDCRFQEIDAEGNYSICDGYFYVGANTGRFNIDGDLYMHSGGRSSNYGTMNLKGDLVQIGTTGYFNGAKGTLELAGSAEQNLMLESTASTLGHIKFSNNNILVKGCFNGTLETDGKIKAADGTKLEISSALDMNNHKLEIIGDTVAKEKVKTGGENGYLAVSGNYWQAAKELEIGSGRVDISGNLRVQSLDEDGDNTTGTGYVSMNDSQGRLNVSGEYVMQSTQDSIFRNGTMTLKGNLFQISTNGATGYFNTSYWSSTNEHTVVLAGSGTQSIQFDNIKSSIGTLKLSRAKSGYYFNPDPCWKKLIEANESGWQFVDVAAKPGNWKYDNIKFVYENGIMTGVNSSEFQPDVPLTRAMFASVIYRLAGSPAVTYKSIFSDVPAGKWYSDAVIWAYEKGIVAGLGNGKYGINDNITREQMARMLMEFARVQGYGTSERADFGKFADATQVSRWATEYMQWAVGSGVISGSTKDGRYYMNPKGQATRAECAVMLTKFIQKNQ